MASNESDTNKGAKTSHFSPLRQQQEREEQILRHIQSKIKNEQERLEQLKKENKSFKVPPVILFVSHENNAALKLLINQFDFLKKLEYSTIGYELDNDISLNNSIETLTTDLSEYSKIPSKDEQVEEILLQLIADKAIIPSEKEKQRKLIRRELDRAPDMVLYGENVTKPLLEFFQSLEKQNKELRYLGLDAPLNDFRSDAQLIATSPKIIQARDEYMAVTLARSALENQGGVVGVMGYGHSGVQKKLQEILGDQIKDCQFFEFDPICNKQFLNPILRKEIQSAQMKFIEKPHVLKIGGYSNTMELEKSEGFRQSLVDFEKIITTKISVLKEKRTSPDESPTI